MGNYKEDLKNLIDLKKRKKDPSKSDKEKFASAWEELVKEEGFSEEAENFLYAGISYYSAVPFHNYMAGKENPMEALNELYKGSLYRKNCATTVPLLFHLLSLSLNEEKKYLSVINSLIEQIPEALINKDKKLYGQAGRAFKKYLIDELNVEAKCPDIRNLMEHGLKKATLQEFIDIIDEVAKQPACENLKEASVKKAQIFNRWLNSLVVTSEQGTRSDKKSDTKNESEKNRDESDRIKTEETTALPRKASVQDEQNAQLRSETKRLKNKNRNLEEKIKNLEGELENKNSCIHDLSAERSELTARVKSLEKEQKETKEELNQSLNMLEIIRRNRQKQTDENQRRLASKLKEFYQDYQDAKDLDMSLELGENIRDQFGEVLDILSSSGIFAD